MSCDSESTLFDLQAVLTHEFGHFVGLDHSAIVLSTMDPGTEPGDCKKRSLHQDDIDGFCQTYTQLPDPEPDVIGENEVESSEGGDVVEPHAADSDPDPGCQTHQDRGLAWPMLFLALLLVRRRMVGCPE